MLTAMALGLVLMQEPQSPMGRFTLVCHVPEPLLMEWKGGRWVQKDVDEFIAFGLTIDTDRRTAEALDDRFELSTMNGHIVASRRDSSSPGHVTTIGYLGGRDDASGPMTFRDSGPAVDGDPAYVVHGVGTCEVDR